MSTAIPEEAGRHGLPGTNGAIVVDEGGRKRIDEALEEWRQGDCVLGEHWFVFRLATSAPLTEEAAAAAEAGVDLGEAEVRGFMVATQTCDIVRACVSRPFVEVAPLVEVDSQTLEDIRKGRRPQYAFVPGVAHAKLVADLDRVMTVEKAVVADWERVPGCSDDNETRQLSSALARKRARNAFPDEFVRLVSPLRSRLSSKHDKDSDEGRALRALREIRVRAAPSWDAEEVALTFWFIRGDNEAAFEGAKWDRYLEAWLSRVPPTGRYTLVEGIVQTMDDMSAREYIESDPLDLDYLSEPLTA